MNPTIKRLWRLRRVRAGLILLGAALFVAVAVAYVDWTGAHRLEEAREMVAREGESLDMHASAPDPVPDDQNFFAIPALKGLALCSTDAKDTSELGLKLSRLANAGLYGDALKTFRDKLPPAPPFPPGASRGVPTDLAAWADWLRKKGSVPALPDTAAPAQVVLAALSKNDALIQELAQGLSRPESQWTPAWKVRSLPDNPLEIALPNYTVTQSLVPMLCLRAAAAARVGDSDAAQLSLLIAARLTQAYMREPLFIGTLVACGQTVVINNAVWELCDAHCGTADQFRVLQEALTKLDFRQGLLCAERGEMAGAFNAIAYFSRTRNPVFLAMASSMGTEKEWHARSFWVRLIPDGFFESNEATLVDWHLRYFLEPLRDAGLMQMLAKGQELDSMVKTYQQDPARHLDSDLAQLWVSAVARAIYKIIYTQSVENQAIAACALERYRIEHGSYPDTLEAANHPGEPPIPLDIVSGKPMGYRKTQDGRYILWCVSFSGVDHGGRRVLDKLDPGHTRFTAPNYQGDWVWSFQEAAN